MTLDDLRAEMEHVKEEQFRVAAEHYPGHERDLWKLQIVWEYLKERVMTCQGYHEDSGMWLN